MRICSVEGCNNKYRGNGYCNKHNLQMRYHGKILERTRFDKNKIIIEDQICKMELYDINCKVIAETIFDLKYYEFIKDYSWHMSGNYVESFWVDENQCQKNMKLHQAIIYLSGQEVPDDCEIDHKDNNPLNNLENNLRICKHSDNVKNRKNIMKHSSKYKGVSFYKHTNKWRAKLRANHVDVFLGYFVNEDDAAKAYNIAAIKYFGEFARLNVIP